MIILVNIVYLIQSLAPLHEVAEVFIIKLQIYLSDSENQG